MSASIIPDLILTNGRITTLDAAKPEAREVVIKDGRIVGLDNAGDFATSHQTKVID